MGIISFAGYIYAQPVIGAGGMALVNSGTIDADESVPLILDPAILSGSSPPQGLRTAQIPGPGAKLACGAVAWAGSPLADGA